MKKFLTMTINLAGWVVMAVLAFFLVFLFWPFLGGVWLTHVAIKKLEINDNAIIGLIALNIVLWVMWLFYLVKLVVEVTG